ncbi:MAG: TIR domain-containing protein [Pseudomonadota bacterium]
MTDVFISYADEDARRVRRIVDGFQAAGVAVFFERESRDGVLWMDATAAQIKQSDAVIVVLSNAAAQSERMAWEVDLAARYGRRLYPAVIEADAPIPKAFTEAVARRNEGAEEGAAPSGVRVAHPAPLWRDERTEETAQPSEKAASEGSGGAAASDKKIEPIETAAGPRTLDGEKIRKLVADVRQSTEAARAAAEGPRTSQGLAKSASLVFAQWRAVEDSDDVRRLKTFRQEFADDPYFSERAEDRIDELRREVVWSRADFAFRMVTGMALVAATVWALRESDGVGEVYSSFAGGATSEVSRSAAAGSGQSDAQLRVMQLQKQVEQERARAQELAAMLEQDDPDVANLQSQLNAAEDRAAALDRDLAAARDAAKAEQVAAARTARELRQARSAAQAAAAARDKAEAEAARLRAARDQAIADRESALTAASSGGSSDERLAAVSAERDRLRAELTKAKSRLATLEQELDEAKRGQAQLADRVDDLAKQLTELRRDRTAFSAVQLPASGGGQTVTGAGSAILMNHFLQRQEDVYATRRENQGTAAKFPVMGRAVITRMQACIEKVTDYRVGVDGIWGLRTSRAVVNMSADQARDVTGCLNAN